MERSEQGGSFFFLFRPKQMPSPTSGPREEQQRVRDLLEPHVADEGFDLVAVQLLVVGGRRTLRLSIDRVGGITIHHCTKLSHVLSPILDVADPLSGAYDLEVSSPGIERPVQKKADFQRFQGYRARIRMAKGTGRQRYTGILRGVDGDLVRLETEKETFTLRFEEIDGATLLLDLEEYRLLTGVEPEDSDQ